MQKSPEGSGVRDDACRDCARDIDHCHGTLVMHSYRHAECTALDCDGPYLLRHSLVIDCVTAQCDCDRQIPLAG
ncbi:MAG: hypothetical protein ACRDUS_11345 [Mycobacterium sp.]